MFDLHEHGLKGLRLMAKIREFEQRLPALSQEGLIRGSTHPSVGMEAVAVGVSMNLEARDAIASNHRGHAHTLAKGADFGRTMAEILGRRDGYCGGKGGSMHIGVAELGVLGTNGIVGAGIGIATGAALAAQVSGDGSVAVAYFGDGGANQGVLAEALNLAAIWSLPVLFVLENNHYAQSAAIEQMVAQPDFTRRGEAYGVPAIAVDGMDLPAVYDAAETAVARARAGEGPSMIVADTYRYLGHMAGDTEIYRSKDEVREWHTRDPLTRLRTRLEESGILAAGEWERTQEQITAEIDEAERYARASALPDPASAHTDVYATQGWAGR
ncbi:thiamine pyrophosphate-dependent dehydrogenase E1 component subunit alpha [Sediminivirga luteola]|uniref:Acetoin:2,6-dichlorophenolindophenol oxidoreductase subunit alpha n=1 Tax=Sediminivirga luteola TaxID=1774748 RepID=A0A8J2XLD6_9MICO|nr:thiamine pyrophosphate-dependent dehydrogenase E1 component subunit alpha [Sediminivirga luteola]MCI2265124.1 thiamine pyrophosphate-dependent dehydrogenase E1 component subunit alpha [Sediminivirga luteola]GGA21964.1 acetoin:2,6-dichlorophenolindophenol oxidoreductase subunit alpha [Sediminivirga luteola]